MIDHIDAAREWIENDPDPDTRSELQAILDSGDQVELNERFASRLEFGTAGIRGTMGAGPGRMNRALVRKVTAGLAKYLLQEIPECRSRGVVVGRDARHLSLEFAQDTAGVLAAAGIRVHFFAEPVPTPICGFAVTELKAAAGIVITASHNPAQDNGYKVFWSDGAQIIPPHDLEISRAVDAVGPARSVTLISEGEAKGKGLWEEVAAEIQESYIRKLLSSRLHPEVPTDALCIVYTPLHGVGGKWVREVLARSGYGKVFVVSSQATPDPDFPTVSSPNPEDPDSLRLACDLGEQKEADLVLANDPDADRLAVLVPKRTGATAGGEESGATSGYRALTGNEIGVLLAQYLLTETDPGPDPLVITTIVSTRLLSRMARALGAHYTETLTGFKWIAARAQELEAASGYRFVMGFEEALGYTTGTLVRDKDGIGAALALVDLAALLRSRGETLSGYLKTIYERYGLHQTGQKSLILPGTDGQARVKEIVENLRSRSPRTIAGVSVVAQSDLLQGTRRETSSSTPQVVDLPRSNVLIFELEDGSRVVVRPSGTEPKLKFYFEVVEAAGKEATSPATLKRAKARLANLKAFFSEP